MPLKQYGATLEYDYITNLNSNSDKLSICKIPVEI